MVTLHDIARSAGVSIGTVSNVLNHTGRVGDATRDRVLNTVAALNYVPNKMAKSLKTSQTNTFGVIAEDITAFDTPAIVDGINDFCEAHGYSISLYNLRIDNKVHDHFYLLEQYNDILTKNILALSSACVDGLIYIGIYKRNIELLPLIRELRLPVVYVYCYNAKEVPYVTYNDYQGALTAARYLLKKNHRKIGLICGPANTMVSDNQIAGYRAALEDEGLPFCSDYVRYGNLEMESGAYHAKRLLTLPDPPTAILTLNDIMAYGVYRYASQTGLRIPEDLSVIGFGNLPFSSYTIPPLTSVSLPLHEIGYTAAQALYHHAEKPQNPQYILDCGLHERASVRSL
ncbi:MAG: LacI family transcriptional regulator [bacterium]|nr:LacI family transcriptional regulator [bacterium]